MVAGDTYTYSVWAKPNTLLDTFAFAVIGGTEMLYRVITMDTMEWKRYEVQYLADVTGEHTLRLDIPDNAPTAGSFGYLFAPQLEEGEHPSSYIPTAGGIGGRGKDILKVDSYNNHPKLEDTNQYTVLMDISLNGKTQPFEQALYTLGYGGAGTGFSLLRINGGEKNCVFFRSGSGHIVAFAVSYPESFRVGVSIDNNTVIGYYNGVKQSEEEHVLQNDNGIFADQISLGCTNASISQLSGHIRNFRIWDRALTEEEMNLA